MPTADELVKGVILRLGSLGDSLGPDLVLGLGAVWVLALVGAAGLFTKAAVRFATLTCLGPQHEVLNMVLPLFALFILTIVPAIVSAVV